MGDLNRCLAGATVSWPTEGARNPDENRPTRTTQPTTVDRRGPLCRPFAKTVPS